MIPHLHNCTNNRTDTGKNCTGDSIYENYEEKEFTSRIMVRHANPIRLCFVPPIPVRTAAPNRVSVLSVLCLPRERCDE